MEKNFTVLGPYVLPITEQLKVGYSIVKKMGCKYLRKTFGDKSAIGNCVPECVAPSIYIYIRAKTARSPVVSNGAPPTQDPSLGSSSSYSSRRRERLTAMPRRATPSRDNVTTRRYVKPYVPDFKRGIDHFCIHAGGRAVIDGIVKNLNLLDRHEAPSRHALYTYGNTSSSSIWCVTARRAAARPRSPPRDRDTPRARPRPGYRSRRARPSFRPRGATARRWARHQTCVCVPCVCPKAFIRSVWGHL